MAPIDPAQAVKLARIRMALRRATGKTIDVEAVLLGGAAQAAANIKEWRALGAADLNLLLDQWVADASTGATGAPAPAKAPGATPAPASADPPPEPPDPKSPPDRRYLRGAR